MVKHSSYPEVFVAPSKHHCSDAALAEMIVNPHIESYLKPAMREELAERAEAVVKGSRIDRGFVAPDAAFVLGVRWAIQLLDPICFYPEDVLS